jgi:hypothetical protein
MSFHKLIQFKALSNNSAMLDHVLQADPALVEKLKMRNVCALIDSELFDRLEDVCGVLSLSKREFIEAALIEGLNQADKIIAEEGVYAHFEASTARSSVVKES